MNHLFHAYNSDKEVLESCGTSRTSDIEFGPHFLSSLQILSTKSYYFPILSSSI